MDTRTGTLAGDRSLKEAYAAQHPYGEWLDRELHTLDKLPVPNHRVARHDQATRDKLYTVFGYTYEDVVGAILPMAQQGGGAHPLHGGGCAHSGPGPAVPAV